MKFRVEEHTETGNNVPSIDIVEDDGCPNEGVIVLGENMNMTEAKTTARIALKSFRDSVASNLRYINELTTR